jgi:hypothetical protein
VLEGVAYKLAIYIEIIHRTTRVDNYKQNMELHIDPADWGDIPGAPPLFRLTFNIGENHSLMSVFHLNNTYIKMRFRLPLNALLLYYEDQPVNNV